jgi:hypothetical protein
MARELRIEYPGAVYHVMNRGDRREAILRDDVDRQRFVEARCGVAGGGEEKAERVRQEELAWQRRSERDLAERPKTDPWKARIARRLRQETTTCLPAGR